MSGFDVSVDYHGSTMPHLQKYFGTRCWSCFCVSDSVFLLDGWAPGVKENQGVSAVALAAYPLLSISAVKRSFD